jgi:hypothetical protein
MRRATIMLAILTFAAPALAEDKAAGEKAEAAEAAKDAPVLAAALKEAKISLAKGLTASEKEGKPISAKFEVEDGKLQLSVYTMKNDKFFEVVVDHKSGKVTKSEPITGGGDLEAAKKQAAAMAKTKGSLRDALTQAEKANPGYKAVSVHPELEGTMAQADLLLLKGAEPKQVTEKLP